MKTTPPPITIDWNAAYSNGRDYAWIDTSSVDRLVSLASSKKEISALDVGCGTGQLARDLAHRGFRVRGVDSSTVAISMARSSVLGSVCDITFSCKDATSPIVGKFDLIVTKYVVAFLADLEKFFINVRRAMTTGSVFVIITPVAESLPPERRSIAIDENLLKDKLSPNFSSVELNRNGADWWIICKP